MLRGRYIDTGRMHKRVLHERAVRRQRDDYADDANDSEWSVVTVLPDDVQCRIKTSALRGLAQGGDSAVVSSRILDERFAAAAFVTGQVDAADPHTLYDFKHRSLHEVRAFLQAVASRGSRCPRHGPFACSCTSLQVLGVLMRNWCDAFVEETDEENLVVHCCSADSSESATTILRELAESQRARTCGRPCVCALVDMERNQVMVGCVGDAFPFPKYVHCFVDGSVITLTKWDALADVERLIREGWNAQETTFWKHKGFHAPRCEGCRCMTAVSASCAFCHKRFCGQCTSLCASCGYYRCCQLCLMDGTVLQRVPIRHCPACGEQSTAREGYLVAGDGTTVLLQHPIC